jgi:hypothetical protein
MTNQAAQPDRRTNAVNRWLRRISTPLLIILAVCLSSLLGIAINAATGNPADLPAFPGPLQLIQQHPWPAVGILTAALALLGWGQQRGRGGTQLPSTALSVTTTIGETTSPGLTEQARVRRIWIDGVMNRSLAEVARIELNLAEHPEAVAHPWGALLRRPGRLDQPLPAGTRIGAVVERCDDHLLILGEPGAGKTTLLLEYVHELLEHGDDDPLAPIPVVFHLSAWASERPPLASWLVDELRLRYGVSRRLATVLVDHDDLAVLLDGLDEVPAERRGACVEAINVFQGEHGQVPLVVCGRTREYQELTAKLTLSGAVEILPMDRSQVHQWLRNAGRQLAGLRATLRNPEHWLWELLETPLLLSIAALTYKNQPATAIRADGGLQQLLNAYIKEMLSRPRAVLAPQRERVSYADDETVHWLAWIAKRMGTETVLYPDWMQPDWLTTRRQQWLVTGGLGIVTSIGVGLVVGLVTGLSFELIAGPAFGLAFGGFSWVAVFLVLGLNIGLGRGSRIKPVEQLQWSWRKGLLGALIVGLATGLLGLLVVGPAKGLTAGLVTGLVDLVVAGFSTRANVQPTAPGEGIRTAARTAWIAGRVAGVIGFLAAVIISLIAGVPVVGGLVFGLATGLLSGLPAALLSGGASYLRHRLLLILLRRDGLIPSDLVGFLEYADSRILVQRVGGGYLFIHRLLQDHFAMLPMKSTPEESRTG